MKQMKKILYLLAMLIAIIVLIFAGTGIVQTGLVIISKKMQIAMSEDLLYHISGSCGVMIAGIICAVYVKKKNYVQNIGKVETFSLKKAFYLAGLTVCICRIIINEIIAQLFSGAFPIAMEQTLESNIYVDILFAIILAPVFEELLFRMGIYCLLRKKFARTSSVIVSAVIFAVLHGYHLQGLISCFVVGVVLTFIYDSTRNINYCIVAHAFCNLFASVMNALEQMEITCFGMALQYEKNGYVMCHFILVIVAVLFCASCFFRMKKNKGHNKQLWKGEEG